MAAKLKIVKLEDVERTEEHGALASHLISRAQGSEHMDFFHAELPAGYAGELVYAGQDEVCYVISGEVELTIDGQAQRVGAGGCFFVAADTQYHYRVTKTPHEIVAAFSPASH